MHAPKSPSHFPGPWLTLGLPCYNERDNIGAVLADSTAALDRLGHSWEILVVDNCSQDGTPDAVRAAALAEPRIRLIVHERNRFYSGSCATILKEARGYNIAIMDSDGQFTADDLPRFVAALAEGASLVFGWRRVRHDPWSRKAISWVFNRLARWHLGFRLHDLNVGLRMFDRRYAEVARIEHALNMANPELYVRARAAGLPVTEVPVQHAERTRGQTCHDFRKLWKLFVTVLSYFRTLRRDLRAAALAPKPAAVQQTARAA
jgi:glycosyltransferase involved in cell wall biosynthesis